MLVVIAYDIPDDARRSRLARLLQSYGDRVQFSVFEAHLEPERLLALRDRVRGLINPIEDSVRFYRLGRAYRARVSVEGVGSVTERREWVIA